MPDELFEGRHVPQIPHALPFQYWACFMGHGINVNDAQHLKAMPNRENDTLIGQQALFYLDVPLSPQQSGFRGEEEIWRDLIASDKEGLMGELDANAIIALRDRMVYRDGMDLEDYQRYVRGVIITEETPGIWRVVPAAP